MRGARLVCALVFLLLFCPPVRAQGPSFWDGRGSGLEVLGFAGASDRIISLGLAGEGKLLYRDVFYGDRLVLYTLQSEQMLCKVAADPEGRVLGVLWGPLPGEGEEAEETEERKEEREEEEEEEEEETEERKEEREEKEEREAAGKQREEKEKKNEAFSFPEGERGQRVFLAGQQEGRRAVVVPVLESGDGVLFADARRRVLLADYDSYVQRGEMVPLRVPGEEQKAEQKAEESAGQEGAAKAALLYHSFLEVYDYYAAHGWVSGDGLGTPCLLLWGFPQAEDGLYLGEQSGFLVFAFGEETGSDLALTAHEMSHAVLTALEGFPLSAGAAGAMNEGICDILGCLARGAVTGEETDWLFGEGEGSPLRSLEEPELFGQPTGFWTLGYVPEASFFCEENDQGGVHQNSSLLGSLGPVLWRAGLQGEEAFSFWTSLGGMILPGMDYSMLEELLPWLLSLYGREEAQEALEGFLREARWGAAPPEQAPPSLCLVRILMEEERPDRNGEEKEILPEEVLAAFYPEEGEPFVTWPLDGEVTALLSPGFYRIALWRREESGGWEPWVLRGENWEPDDSPLAGELLELKEGECLMKEGGKE